MGFPFFELNERELIRWVNSFEEYSIQSMGNHNLINSLYSILELFIIIINLNYKFHATTNFIHNMINISKLLSRHSINHTLLLSLPCLKLKFMASKMKFHQFGVNPDIE